MTEQVMDDIDKTKIRPICKASLLKMAACTDLATRPQVDNCMQKSQQGMTVAQNVLQSEMQQFQQRLERCMLDCQDNARDANYKSDDAREKLFYSCATTCVDKNMALLKGVKARIESEIDKSLRSLEGR